MGQPRADVSERPAKVATVIHRVGTWSLRSPSRSAARRDPLKADGVVCGVRGSRLPSIEDHRPVATEEHPVLEHQSEGPGEDHLLDVPTRPC